VSRERKIIIIVTVFVSAIFGLIFLYPKLNLQKIIIINNEEIEDITEEDEEENHSPLSGLPCENFDRRPLGVVLANDPVARPLAGLSEADIVFEMPVITGSITRIIAVYVCNSPEEIGPLRSARHDFIPLMQSIDAIFTHWGGSHFALDKLSERIIDNIDALNNSYRAFYRDNKMKMPHNAFTSFDRLLKAAENLDYRIENKFKGYKFEISKSKIQNPKNNNKKLSINYAYPYDVEYVYNSEDNLYLRYRAGKAEIDRNNNKQIKVKNIVIMKVFSEQIEGPDYNDLDIEGKGDCQIYQNGDVVDCIWQKDSYPTSSKLYFWDMQGKEITFIPGQTWIELVELEQKVIWE